MNERQIVHTNNGSLVLRKVLQSDAGIYNCTVTALNHRFNPNNMMNRDGTTFHSRNKNSGSKRTKNKSKVFQFETNGLKSASSSMRIKVIGKKSQYLRIDELFFATCDERAFILDAEKLRKRKVNCYNMF